MKNHTGLLLACCAAGAAKAIEPPLWIFYPPGQELFDAGWADVRFVTSAAAILSILFLLAGGLLGDVYGRRRLLLVGLAAAVVANTCLLFAPPGSWHILWRALAIVAGAFILPLALAPLYSFFAGKQQARALSWYILSTSLALLLASRQGRLAIALLDWRAAYLLPALIGLVALGLTWKYVPEQKVAGRRHVVVVGHIGWTLIILAIVFGLLEATVANAWLAVILGGAFLTFLIGVIAVAWWNMQTPPALQQGLQLRTRDVTALIATGVILQLLLLGFYLPTHDLFDLAQGRSTWGTWLALAPMAAGMLASLLVINRLLHALQVGQLLASGLAVVAVAIGLMAISPLTMPYIWQALALFAFGLAILATKTVWTNGFFQTLVGDYVGVNAAMYSATLQIGSVVGAFLGTLLPIRFGQAAMQDQLATQLGQSGQVAQLLDFLAAIIVQRVPLAADPHGELLLDAYRSALAAGYTLTCWVLAGLALLAAIVIAAGVRRSLRFRRVAGSAMVD